MQINGIDLDVMIANHNGYEAKKEEVKILRQALWAIIKDNGGMITIPKYLLMLYSYDSSIICSYNYANNCYELVAK